MCACLQTDPSAVPIRVVKDIVALRASLGYSSAGGAGGGDGSSAKPAKSGRFGTGGMQTKLVAAQLSTAAGVMTVICHNTEVDRVEDMLEVRSPECALCRAVGSALASSVVDATPCVRVVIQGAEIGTRFLPVQQPIRKRKRWLMGLSPAGASVVAPACRVPRQCASSHPGVLCRRHTRP